MKTILVGVDLSHGDWLASPDGHTPSHGACEQAISLAASIQDSGGPETRILFMAALDLDERTKRLLAESPKGEETVLHQAEHAVNLQVAAASKAGVQAEGKVVVGSPRITLVEQAAETPFDLVVVGSRGQGLIAGMLLGSTSMALISNCSTPVWVVKPGHSSIPRRILVGTDFSPVCNELFDYGVKLAKLFDAELHLTHVVERARRPFLQLSEVDQTAISREHEKTISEARGQLEDMAARPDAAALNHPVVVHLTDGDPSNVIADQTRILRIDLLLVGTVAWSGVPGMIIGSTAHKMLATLECSLFTMRPNK